MNDPDTTSTSSGSSLDNNRESELFGSNKSFLRVTNPFDPSRWHGNTGPRSEVSCLDLVSHQFNMFRSGANKGNTAGLTDLCELGVLSKKTVSRMDRFTVRYLCGADHGRDVQIALQRIGRTNAYPLVREAGM